MNNNEMHLHFQDDFVGNIGCSYYFLKGHGFTTGGGDHNYELYIEHRRHEAA